MFPCCDLCGEFYLKDEPGFPISEEDLRKANEKHPDIEPMTAENACRCPCHVIGSVVLH